MQQIPNAEIIIDHPHDVTIKDLIDSKTNRLTKIKSFLLEKRILVRLGTPKHN